MITCKAKNVLRCSMCDEPLSWARARTMIQVVRPDVASNDAACVRAYCFVCFSEEQKEEMKRHYDRKGGSL